MNPTDNSGGNKSVHYKRQAKKLKKQMGISHTEALNQLVRPDGFSNWQHFTNSGGQNVPIAITSKPIPSPSVLPYQMFLQRKPYKRPNAKMAITAHQEIGRLLKEVHAASHYRKSVNTPVGIVRSDLDDWIQKEYTSRTELSDEVFSEIYFRGDYPAPQRTISDEQHVHFVSDLRRVQQILSEQYHQCAPVTEMQKRLDSAINALDRWHDRTHLIIAKPPTSRPSIIKEGTLVWLKPFRCYALAYRDKRHDSVGYYGKGGFYMVARHEVSVPRDHAVSEDLTPMRLYLPYGKWRCADGTEVLYNRDYCPIWARTPDGKVSTLDPDTWISGIQSSVDYYYADKSTPWNDHATFVKCMNALKEWGVHNGRPRILEMFDDIVKNGGDFDDLKEKNHQKLFPKAA